MQTALKELNGLSGEEDIRADKSRSARVSKSSANGFSNTHTPVPFVPKSMRKPPKRPYRPVQAALKELNDYQAKKASGQIKP